MGRGGSIVIGNSVPYLNQPELALVKCIISAANYGWNIIVQDDM